MRKKEHDTHRAPRVRPSAVLRAIIDHMSGRGAALRGAGGETRRSPGPPDPDAGACTSVHMANGNGQRENVSAHRHTHTHTHTQHGTARNGRQSMPEESAPATTKTPMPKKTKRKGFFLFGSAPRPPASLIIFCFMAEEKSGPSSCSDSSSYTLPAESFVGAVPGFCQVVSLVSCARGAAAGACETSQQLVSGRRRA